MDHLLSKELKLILKLLQKEAVELKTFCLVLREHSLK